MSILWTPSPYSPLRMTDPDGTPGVPSGGKYRVIMVDPPWEFTTWSDKAQKSAKRHYRTMDLDDIKKLRIAELAAPGCALALWVTEPNLPDCLDTIKAWGFHYLTCLLSWIKITVNGKYHFGLGYYTRANPERCLLAVKIDSYTKTGKPVYTTPTRLAHDVPQLLVAEVGKHSAKPLEQYTRIERLFPGPYLELFARRIQPGWVAVGDEITGRDIREDIDMLIQDMESEEDS